jgi:hypothetical protein
MVGLRQSLWIILAGAAVLLLSAGGCGNSTGSGFSDNLGGAGSGNGSDDSGVGSGSGDNGGGGGPGGGIIGTGGTPAKPCTNGGLSCYVKQGCSTTLKGVVHDPAGMNPLYNVVVFVPNDPMGKLPPITPGTKSCNTCDAPIGNYVSVATTNYKGEFTLTGVPATTHVPLVVQTGKWRREVFLSKVTACTDNMVAAADSRLPGKRSEGDMPQMLLMTGGCDDLGCFLNSIGVDPSEFSAPHGGGRLDVYSGSGAGSLLGGLGGLIPGSMGAGLSSGGTAGTWGTPTFTKANYEYYDIAILSCECAPHQESTAGMQALHDWANEGGKVFASHYNYTWFSTGPADFQGVANWKGAGAATGMGTYNLDTSFPKGMILQQWLANLKAVTGNTITLNSVADSVTTVNSPTVRWIYDPNMMTGGDAGVSTANDVKYLSFLTPIGGIPGMHPAGEANQPAYCGKVVFTDLHTSSSLLASAMNIPGDCKGGALTAQQAALEFLFFDLSACVAPDNQMPPPVPPSVQ